MSDWQPMDTAPKDRTVLAFFPDCYGAARYRIVWWRKDERAAKPRPHWADSDNYVSNQRRRDPPTHWMPLPKPPVTP